MSIVPLVVIPAGVAVAAASSGSPPSRSTVPTNVSPSGQPLGTASSGRGATIGELVATGGKVPVSGGGKLAALNASSLAVRPGISIGDAAINSSSNFDAQAQAKLDEIKKYGQAVYDQMSADAKKKSAAALSDAVGLEPPLTGDESWEDIAKITGGAVGAAALGWIPTGQIWGPIVGAYLGVKLEELMSKNVDEIKGWFKARWSDVESWVHGVVDDIEDGAEDVFDYLGSLF